MNLRQPAITGGAAAVGAVIRDITHAEVLPYYGSLASSDVSEKSAGDIVTVADLATEAALAERLTSMVPGSAVVGEEAVSADPSLVEQLATAASVWIIDPIDGTANFAIGDPRFTTMVALAQDGELVSSWIYAPVLGLMASAVAGGGTYLNGRRIVLPTPHAELRSLDITTARPQWWTAGFAAQVERLGDAGATVSSFTAAGVGYLDLLSGVHSAMLLSWESVWDHAAGLLLHAEAGGVSRGCDGRKFTLTGGNALPFIVAPTVACVDLICDVVGQETAGASGRDGE